MANNYSYSGKTVDYKNTGATPVLSGAVVLLGELVGVAQTDIQPGKVGAVQVEEVFILPKKAADALALGDAVYWSEADKTITKTETGNIRAGIAFGDAPANSASVPVKLNA